MPLLHTVPVLQWGDAPAIVKIPQIRETCRETASWFFAACCYVFFKMSRRSCQEINDRRMTGTGRPAYDEGTTEQRDGKKTTEQSPRGRRERQDDRNQRRRPRRKEDTMKNSTFDQI
ncbi:hypothetical protein, partial [Bifidobacterium moukalabense]|uniref:hypothetical protein n=1 Tax=Bifidobacterium moukalabense TaxID=1333651 RepID=UPI0010F62D0F